MEGDALKQNPLTYGTLSWVPNKWDPHVSDPKTGYIT